MSLDSGHLPSQVNLFDYIFQAVTKISQFNGVYFTVRLSLSHLLADFLSRDNFLSLSSFLIYLLLVSLSMFDQG
jgi:hypothetical protein